MNGKAALALTGWLVLINLMGLVACNPVGQPPGLVTQADPDQLGVGAALTDEGHLYLVVREDEYLMLYRSDNQGRSWGEPVRVNEHPEPISASGENHPKVVIAQDGGLLVSWTRPLERRFTGEIRLARASDRRHFSPPIRVHRDDSEITHRFESMQVLRDGRVLLAWIDKRDLEAAKKADEAYRGAAVYAAISHDHGRSFEPEVKVADHSCECCRIAMAQTPEGQPLLFWRHIFPPNERDHAIALLGAEGQATRVKRANFDRWAVNACPHQGPGLAVDDQGVRHGVWFNVRDNQGQVFYGRLSDDGVQGQRPLASPHAAHADVATRGDEVTLVWQAFDGERHQLVTQTSQNGGREFSRPRVLADTSGRADQPRLVQNDDTLLVLWHTSQEGVRVYPL